MTNLNRTFLYQMADSSNFLPLWNGGDGGESACRYRYGHIDLPPIRPVATRIELYGGRCRACGRRYRAEAPATMPPGSPFGPGIRAPLMYLHRGRHVGFERLSRIFKELFGLNISEGAIANVFRRMETGLEAGRAAIKAKLLEARGIASDETTTRVDGVTHWQWVFVSDRAALHEIAPNRPRDVASSVLGDHHPEVWISDRCAGQQELGPRQVLRVPHRSTSSPDQQRRRTRDPSVVFRKVTNGFRIHVGRRDPRRISLRDRNRASARRIRVRHDPIRYRRRLRRRLNRPAPTP